jgi:anti-sigma factor RsiW
VTDPQQIQRAASSLRRAVASAPDDFDHPDHQDLVAFAESRLDGADREIVESHIAMCAQCAEDVRDVTEIRGQMAAPAAAPKQTWKYAVGALAGIAALLALAVLLRRPEPTPVTTEASAPSASPREGVTPASPRQTALRDDEKTIVDAAIAARRVDIPADARALAGSVGQLLGGTAASAAMLPMSPSGTFVATASPQFSWQPVGGAASYRVAVFDAAFRELASSGPLTKTSWTPASPLPVSVPLAWQVTARMADGSEVLAPLPPRPEARFSVIDAATAAKIAELRTRLSDQPLALGILLAKAGLIDEAARELDRASAQPALADTAAALRSSLKPQR